MSKQYNQYTPLEERFATQWMGEPNSGCWLWTGVTGISTDRAPHCRPLIEHKCKRLLAHRVSYELHIGPIPAGMFVCHKCDKPLCVNPAHLFLGNHLDNVADMVRKRRHARGERHGRAKLKTDDVAAIRASDESSAALSSRYGISDRTIRKIRSRQIWGRP